MAIKLKAKETLIRVGKYAGTYRYVLSPELYNRMAEQKIIAEAALRSGLNNATIKAAYDSLGLVLSAWATEGLICPIPGLGSMRFGVKASSASHVDKVSSDLITARKVIFVPSVAIKQELKATSVSIACYDRNGKLVKTVTSKGDEQGDFEVELIASPEEGGTFEGAGFYNENAVAVVRAIPASGYQFVKWDDDELSAERTINVTEDINHVATFRKIDGSGTTMHTLSVTASPTNGGNVSGSGQYQHNAVATLTASPASGYRFARWSDGNTQATRSVVMSADVTLTATFESISSGGGTGFGA